jgi:hypothetical protein
MRSRAESTADGVVTAWSREPMAETPSRIRIALVSPLMRRSGTAVDRFGWYPA